MKLSSELKVAILTIAGILLLVFGYKFLKGKKVFSSQNEFVSLYDNVDGLIPGNPVLLNGFKVGSVESVNLVQNRTNQLAVNLTLEADVDIPRNSIARIVSADLLGEKAIELEMVPSNGNLASGDTMRGELEMDFTDAITEELKPLKGKIENLFQSLDSVLLIINRTLGSDKMGASVNSIDRSFASLERSLDNLEVSSKKLKTLITSESERISVIFTNVEKLTNTLANKNSQIEAIFDNVADLSTDLSEMDLAAAGNKLNATLEQAQSALDKFNQTMTKVNEGDGSLALLLEDDALYNNLEKASNDLDELFIDMKANPNRYVHFSLFGRKDKSKK